MTLELRQQIVVDFALALPHRGRPQVRSRCCAPIRHDGGECPIDALQLNLRLDDLLVASGLDGIDALGHKLPGIGVQSACFCKVNLGKGA